MQTSKYSSKAVNIEAVELTKDNVDELSKWCGGRPVEMKDALDEEKTFVGLNIPTLEGTMRASEGDFIIKGLRGEFYPCKPDVFHAKYEELVVPDPVEVDSELVIEREDVFESLDPGVREARVGDSLRSRADAAARYIVGRSSPTHEG